MAKLTTMVGAPLPTGATLTDDTVNFSLYCEAKALTLALFDETLHSYAEIKLDPRTQKTGNMWHIAIKGLPLPLYYAYRLEGCEIPELSDSKSLLLLDPYATATSSSHIWGEGTGKLVGRIAPQAPFDWEGDRPLNLPPHELIIYEMHVRGFTCDPSSQVAHPGTFLGIIEKIPYLKELGINAVEFLPVHEFNEMDCGQFNPTTNQKLLNYWGYSTLSFFSLMNRYSTGRNTNVEFKTVVRELHKNGIEVILDVVFNHTGEGNERGPICSFKGLGNTTYYMFDSKNGYSNYSGCGNTLSCNAPLVIQMIIDCLRYWVVEMHVDGFRFDLAALFFRDFTGAVLPFSPVIRAITLDPILAETKLIAEPWDAAGLYQLGNFYPQANRWSEWNDRYRDIVRSFIKGTPGTKPEFATALCGSQDVFGGRSPAASINFVTSHDGFTLADLVSYNHKHNENNGEGNRDGHSFNDSWNCGVEGPTTDPRILALRERQMRNFHVALLVSQGIPMIHMGDEYGHTKHGNNNTWCQDTPLNWFLWDRLEKNKGFYRFYRLMIAFRKKHSLLRHTAFLTPEDIDWYNSEAMAPIWEDQNSFLAFVLKNSKAPEALYIAFNAHNYPIDVQLPTPRSKHRQWARVVDTGKAPPEDFSEHPSALSRKTYTMQGNSAAIFTTCALSTYSALAPLES